MQHDLLANPIGLAYAVNCELNEESIRIGALFIEANISDSTMRLTHEDVTVDVELPKELLNSPAPLRAWDIELPLTHEQVL